MSKSKIKPLSLTFLKKEIVRLKKELVDSENHIDAILRGANSAQDVLSKEIDRLRQQLDESEQDRIDAQRVNQHLSRQLEAAKPWYKRLFSK